MTQRSPLAFVVRDIALFERPTVLRMPFRFGAATVTACPQAFVRVKLDIGGKIVQGASAELMVPKWFDKAPLLSHDDNFNQLRQALLLTRAAYLATPHAPSAWILSARAGGAAISRAVVRHGLPRLVAQFGPALIDKAVADAVLRACNLDWVSGVRAGALGDPWSPHLRLHRPQTVWVRHTVGLADRLDAADRGPNPADGLPITLGEVIARTGVRYFKLKLSGQIDTDLERLTRIEAVLARAPDYRVTLDGNETFTSLDPLSELFAALRGRPATSRLLQRTLLLEQPLARQVALINTRALASLPVPVILDESDDESTVLEQGLAAGYRGISTKACKGLYRSLAHAARLHGRHQLILSGEDLTCQAGLAVQQDTLLAASLGVTHIERNGHHYVRGFGVAPEAEADAFLQAHAGLYKRDAAGIHLRINDGRLDLRSLHRPGFARSAAPSWETLSPLGIPAPSI